MPEKLTSGPRVGYDLSRVGAGAARGPGLKKNMVAAAWSGTWPAPGSTLDLDFANDRGWVRGVGQGRSMDAVTFTRASTGRYIDSTGTLVAATDNVPRFDWASTTRTGAGTAADPYVVALGATSTCNGLLIEESRANRILWCRDATQANWTCTDVTAAKDQTGIDGVANAASSLTASADGGTCIQTITLASGSRTGSVYLKRLTGTGNVQVSLDGSTWSTVDLSDTEWRRIVLSGTVTNPAVGIKLATNGDAVAMDYAQVEDNTTNGGTLATSPILTTSSSATRAGDFASISGGNFLGFYKFSQKTLYAELIPYCASNQNAMAFFANTTTYNESVGIVKTVISASSFFSGTTFTKTNYYYMYNSLVTAANLNKSKIAYSQSAWYAAFAANGLVGSAYDGQRRPLGDLAAPSRMWIGGRDDGVQLNGAVSRVMFFDKNMSETQLSELTR